MDTNNNNVKVMELAGREVIVHEAKAIVCRGCRLVLFGSEEKITKKAKEQGWAYKYGEPYCGECIKKMKRNKRK